MKILITGGAGFIASHFVESVLKNTNWDIVILDKFTYAANGLTRLKEIGAYDNGRVKLYVADVSKPLGLCLEHEIGHVDYIMHMAAGTHVDNSIKSPRDFVESNVFGSFEMLEYARRVTDLKKFVYFSTDEVFGSAASDQTFSEWDRYNSCNPYSATKASGEELTLAWANTYKVPAFITHTTNVIGIRQHPEKFLPKIIKSILCGEELVIHVNPVTGKAGTRKYLHCEEVSDALLFLLERGEFREKYNIGEGTELSNLELAIMVADILDKPLRYRKEYPAIVRPGVDARYSVSSKKINSMGWCATRDFNVLLTETVKWMADTKNSHWLSL
jgi:dTDP-glucose 4,6-dehydratase